MTKNFKVTIMLNPEEKELLECAAFSRKTSLEDFILFAALEFAKTDVEKAENIILTGEEAKRAISLIDNPPEPNQALRKLFE